MVEECAPEKCHFLANWVPAAKNNQIKFWKKCVLIGLYNGCKLTPVALLFDILYSRNTSECCTGLKLVPRAVGTVGRVVSTIFVNAMATPSIFMSFGTLSPNLTSKFSNSRKNWWHGPFEIFQLHGETKNSEIDNFYKMGSYSLGMRRGFHIWSQNLNQTSFDPLLDKKTVETGFFQFSIIFGQKGVQMLFDLNFENIFEILPSFPVYMTHFLLKVRNVEFFVPIIMLKI